MKVVLADASRSHYEVLGVRRDATLEEIRQAHRHLAMMLHPDRHLSAPEGERKLVGRRMREVNEAWTVLSDGDHRFEYDRLLHDAELREALSRSGEQPAYRCESTQTGSRPISDDVPPGHSSPHVADDVTESYHRTFAHTNGSADEAVFYDAIENEDAGSHFAFARAGVVVVVLGILGAIFLGTAYAGSVRDKNEPPVGSRKKQSSQCVSVQGDDRAAVPVPCSAPNDGQVVATAETPLSCPDQTTYALLDTKVVCLTNSPDSPVVMSESTQLANPAEPGG